jgi:hypothetical protein
MAVIFTVRPFPSFHAMLKANRLIVDLDYIYATTCRVAEYPFLASRRIDAAEYSATVARFEEVRRAIRTFESVFEYQSNPILAVGWFGEIGTGVEQCALELPRSWQCLVALRAWWRNIRNWFSSMEVGIDGV